LEAKPLGSKVFSAKTALPWKGELILKSVAIRINNLYVEQLDVDTIRFIVIDDYRGRALGATVFSDDIEELQRVVGTSLLGYYESEIKRLNDCLKEQRKILEEEKKLKHPNIQYIKNVEETIAHLEKSLENFERKKEALKKLLEALTFL
jgi:predicted ribosome quality control (RQC) complex YloA/Tae2 family protein